MNKASKKNKKSKRKNKASKKNKSKKNKSKKKSKKAQKKNNKKNTKKSRKANKNKNKKARRKNKANKKEKKSKRKNKKAGRKNKSKKNRSKQERQGYGRDVPDTCLTTSVNILYNGLSKKASNFDRQEARVETRVPVIAKKLEKASEYNATLDYLKALNSSNCPSGDATLLTALIATLGECETNIKTACAAPIYNQTQIDECTPIVAGFQAEIEKCFKLNSNPTAACDCWESDSMAELEKGLKGCVIKESEQNVTDTFKECKKAVSTCNKDRVLAIPLLVNCSKTEAELKAEATAVANNINSLNSAKAAIEKVAKSTRSAGRAAATDCVTFTALVDELVALTPDSPKIEAIAKDIAESTSVTCTAAQKAALTASVTKLDTLIAEAKEKLEALQAELEAITGTTAVIATTPLITTAASSGRRRGFMRQFKM